VSFVCLAPSAPLQGARRPITEMDLFSFVWIADPQMSPDGSQVAFVRVTVNTKDDRYDTSIWLVPASGAGPARPFTAGPRDTSPRWSPDSRRLAFVRAAEKDGKVQPSQIFVLDMQGGEARPVTDVPRGAAAPSWSPDGRTLAFSSQALAKDAAQKPETTKADASGTAAQPATTNVPSHQSDVRVITKAAYRSNGAGYNDPERRSHVWTVALPGPGGALATPRQLTSGAFDESSATWSPDGGALLFTSVRTLEPYYEEDGAALYLVPATGGEIRRLGAIAGSVSQPSISPDGRAVAVNGTLRGNPVRSFSQPDLFVIEPAVGTKASTGVMVNATGSLRNLTVDYDFDIGGGIGGDQHAPRAEGRSALGWTPDGQSILTLVAEQGRANLVRVHATDGKVTEVTTGNHEVISWSMNRDATKAVVLISTPTSIGDLFTVDLTRREPSAASAMTPLTHVNDGLFSELDVPAPEEIWFPSFDGRRIQGWILKPPAFDPAKKYPLVLQIHGGPHSAYGWTFTHEFDWMAAKGYVVLYTNPRGSSSYGQAFGNLIQYRYPGDDYNDLMAGVDELLKRGYVDEKRLGVTGGSGGGVLTNWTITQTTRFAAAVSQRSIADWSAFWYTADFTLFQPTWFKAAPWQDPGDFTNRSAITHVDRVTTPLMLVEGEADYRTPPGAGGEMMFRALKYLKKPVVMVRFPGESHELSRSGQPWHRVERLQHIVGWFDKWLQGKDSGAYDVKD
jgi:dipeptidyl aminopeptidase/acylaminoacyl peptidase